MVFLVELHGLGGRVKFLERMENTPTVGQKIGYRKMFPIFEFLVLITLHRCHTGKVDVRMKYDGNGIALKVI